MFIKQSYGVSHIRPTEVFNTTQALPCIVRGSFNCECRHFITLILGVEFTVFLCQKKRVHCNHNALGRFFMDKVYAFTITHEIQFRSALVVQ